MAETFISEIWSRYILDQLDKRMVGRNFVNYDWEGEIKNGGDRVNIWTPGSITTKTYTKDTDHDEAETTTGTDQTLIVNQQKYFNFQIDKITSTQVPVPMLTKYMDRALYSLRDTVDQYIMALYSSVSANITRTPTATLSSSNVYTEFLALGRLMDDAKIPREGRRIAISPRVLEVINQYLGARSTSLGDAVTINGYLGNFAGFECFLSHNVTETDENMEGTSSTETVHNCLAGTTQGITFAMQIAEGSLEMYKPEKRFAQAVKGLIVYGAKMLDSGARNGLLKAWFSN